LCVNKEVNVYLYTQVFRLSGSGSNYGDQARAGHQSSGKYQLLTDLTRDSA